MPDTAYAVIVLLLVLAGLYWWPKYRSSTKEERRRAKAIAAATLHRHDALSPSDSAWVAEHSVAAEAWRTSEQPVVGLDDPLGASPLDSYWRLPTIAVEDTPLFRDTLAYMIEPVLDPFALESFTMGWTKAEIDDITARAKAAAS